MPGVIPNQRLSDMIDRGEISATVPVTDAQVQPASLDLRLGDVAYRVRASFLAGQDAKVADRLGEFEMHRVDLTPGAVLKKAAFMLCL